MNNNVKVGLTVLAALLLIFVLYNCTNVPSFNQAAPVKKENFYNNAEEFNGYDEDFYNNEEEFEDSNEAVQEQPSAPVGCYPKEQLSASDLLPLDDSCSKWAQVNPSGKGELKERNFLVAGHHIGINTVGQSLRNANRQLRSDPHNPQVKVSPWSQSTIEPDNNRKPLEIGGTC